MRTQLIAVSDLVVNESNDRHGDLAGEPKAIEWLLEKKGSHMRNLALDIVRQGRLYERPLLYPNGDRFVVYDGNRRVTCLKLLLEPARAPDPAWRRVFERIARAATKPLPREVECDVEDDLDVLNEILYRRHTGGQNGVGQSQWEDVAKGNFIGRTGKNTRINVAEEVERLLREGGMLGEGEKTQRSSVNRLLSSEQYRNRLGISVSGRHLTFIRDRGKSLAALRRMTDDLSRDVNLADIWDGRRKHQYLDGLERDGVLPGLNDIPTPTEPTADATPQGEPKPRAPGAVKPQARETLIPSGTTYRIPDVPELRKLREIWRELQFKLRFADQPNAIAMLFRAVVELSIEHCLTRKSLSLRGSLNEKFERAADALAAAGAIDAAYRRNVAKFRDNESLISAHTLHQYVHDQTFQPSADHLRPMWDTLEGFIVAALSSQAPLLNQFKDQAAQA